MYTHYDIVIAGGGASGLSLAYHMSLSGLSGKKILIIDKDPKTNNDRTWCYWEKYPGPFEQIVFKKWDKVWVHSRDHSMLLTIEPYLYKMIRSADYYHFIKKHLSDFKNIHFLTEQVVSISEENSYAQIVTEHNTFQTDLVLSSIIETPPKFTKSNIYLLQHFLGWFIEAQVDCFNPDEAHLMDFRVPQQNGTCFSYVLPYSKRKALVEFTVFSPEIWSSERYNAALTNYLREKMDLKDFTILSSEFGVIPMTDMQFPLRKGSRIYYIGTAGGNTKASTGYTFTRIHKNSMQIVRSMLKTGYPDIRKSCWEKRFGIYDSTLLHVLNRNVYTGDKVFNDLFKKNKPAVVLSFLDETTTFTEEFGLMLTVPAMEFGKGMIRAVRNRFKS